MNNYHMPMNNLGQPDLRSGVEKSAKAMGLTLLVIAGAGAGVLGLIAGAIAGHPGKGALIGAFGVPILLKMAWKS